MNWFTKQVRDGADNGPFAYGGGFSSMQYLAKTLGGLAVAWPHCLTRKREPSQ